MNKTQLVDAVAEAAGIKKNEAEKAVNAVTAAIADALKAGEKVQIIGFGTFSVKHCAAKEVRIPKTGEKKVVPATDRPKFTAGQALKDAVAKK